MFYSQKHCTLKKGGHDLLYFYTIIWTLSRTIKRLLKKYKYPGNFKEIIQLVVKQAEHWDVIRENEGQRGA